ncbi:hypothetical protein CEXT_482261 [Caerostris extrusa]|uniref:Uncharacterized protein n=1 Tax=Caerostris extrusa TaxID=172846 RepID=A0AAV4W6W1_CAEEX|nr:hypothetical protein CEXT_482261 [Caerostris extrusa]
MPQTRISLLLLRIIVLGLLQNNDPNSLERPDGEGVLQMIRFYDSLGQSWRRNTPTAFRARKALKEPPFIRAAAEWELFGKGAGKLDRC